MNSNLSTLFLNTFSSIILCPSRHTHDQKICLVAGLGWGYRCQGLRHRFGLDSGLVGNPPYNFIFLGNCCFHHVLCAFPRWSLCGAEIHSRCLFLSKHDPTWARAIWLNQKSFTLFPLAACSFVVINLIYYRNINLRFCCCCSEGEKISHRTNWQKPKYVQENLFFPFELTFPTPFGSISSFFPQAPVNLFCIGQD